MFEMKTSDIVIDKITLFYIIKNAHVKLTNSQLTQIVLDNKVMNYFYLQTVIAELIDNKLLEIIKKDNKEYYALSPMASQMVDLFYKDMPESLVVKLNAYLEIHKDNLESDQTQAISGYIKHSDSEFTVNLRVLEQKTSLMDINLNVPTLEQAEYICNSWDKNASVMFAEIIQLLTRERES